MCFLCFPPLFGTATLALTSSAAIVQAAGIELVLPLAWELLSKIGVSLASKTFMWQGTLSAGCCSACWEGDMNARQPDRFWTAGESK